MIRIGDVTVYQKMYQSRRPNGATRLQSHLTLEQDYPGILSLSLSLSLSLCVCVCVCVCVCMRMRAGELYMYIHMERYTGLITNTLSTLCLLWQIYHIGRISQSLYLVTAQSHTHTHRERHTHTHTHTDTDTHTQYSFYEHTFMTSLFLRAL